MTKSEHVEFESRLIKLFKFMKNGEQKRIDFTMEYMGQKYKHVLIFCKFVGNDKKRYLIKHVCFTMVGENLKNGKIEWYSFHEKRERKFETASYVDNIHCSIRLFSRYSKINFEVVFEKMDILILECL